jgi:hypothetical protein
MNIHADDGLGDYHGDWREIATGMIYGRRVVTDNPYGRVIHCKNETHTWTGPEDLFKAQFEPAGKPEKPEQQETDLTGRGRAANK